MPSSGSTIHTRSAASRAAESADSSERMASPGKAAESASTITRLAAWSASVTGEPPSFSTTRALP